MVGKFPAGGGIFLGWNFPWEFSAGGSFPGESFAWGGGGFSGATADLQRQPQTSTPSPRKMTKIYFWKNLFLLRFHSNSDLHTFQKILKKMKKNC